MELQKGDALVIVDVQNDFLSGGALPVPHGDDVVPVLNTYITKFVEKELPVFATRDWHPRNHSSFTEYGGRWPRHCVINTFGAEFPLGLHFPPKVIIISKAIYVSMDAYSGFSGTSLNSRLTDMGITRVFIGGLATDYCVKATVQDAVVNFGHNTYYLQDASRAVNVKPTDGEEAEQAMKLSGAKIITLKDLE